MIDPVHVAARIVRDWGMSTRSAMVSRAANAFAVFAAEPQWWLCATPGWWSVQTIWIGDDSDGLLADPSVDAFIASPVQLLVEIVDNGHRGVAAIDDWKPQPRDTAYATQDRSFGHVLPGQGPVHVLAHSPPPFGRWEAA
jgi:hypothetical protein